MSYNAAIERMNYYSDSRVISSMRDRAFTVEDLGNGKVAVKPCEYLVEPDEDDDMEPLDKEYIVPVSYEVCGQCRGSGTVVNSSIDSNGLTADDFYDDPDFADDYFSGRYDIACPECNGKRVVPGNVLEYLPENVAKVLIEWQQSCDEDLAERLAELRMGC